MDPGIHRFSMKVPVLSTLVIFKAPETSFAPNIHTSALTIIAVMRG
jgi:hypothetical protein